MRKLILGALALAGALLFLAGGARAQTQTTVSATVVDPQGFPYANGTYSIQLIPAGTPTVNGNKIGGAFNGSTDANGHFVITLWPNASISPGGSKWQFVVCTNPGGVPPPVGTGNQCTPPTAFTIAGTSQDLSSSLDAIAPRLTVIPSTPAPTPSVILSSTVTLTPTQVKSLAGTPVAVVPAPGVGFFVAPVLVVLQYQFNTTAYSNVTGNLSLQWAGGTALDVGSAAGTGWADGTVDAIAQITVNGALLLHPTAAQTDNKALQIFNLGTDWTLGDGSIRVVTYYTTPATF